MGDRVAVMRGGVLQQVAPPQELYDRPVNLFVAEFIGSPAMNLVGPTSMDDAAVRRARAPLAEAAHAERPALGRVRRPSGRARHPPGGHRGRGAGARDSGQAPLPVEVDIREDMGSEVFVHFSVPGEPVQDTRGPRGDGGGGRRRRRPRADAPRCPVHRAPRPRHPGEGGRADRPRGRHRPPAFLRSRHWLGDLTLASLRFTGNRLVPLCAPSLRAGGVMRLVAEPVDGQARPTCDLRRRSCAAPARSVAAARRSLTPCFTGKPPGSPVRPSLRAGGVMRSVAKPADGQARPTCDLRRRSCAAPARSVAAARRSLTPCFTGKPPGSPVRPLLASRGRNAVGGEAGGWSGSADVRPPSALVGRIWRDRLKPVPDLAFEACFEGDLDVAGSAFETGQFSLRALGGRLEARVVEPGTRPVTRASSP